MFNMVLSLGNKVEAIEWDVHYIQGSYIWGRQKLMISPGFSRRSQKSSGFLYPTEFNIFAYECYDFVTEVLSITFASPL